jgi:hypothetical protein
MAYGVEESAHIASCIKYTPTGTLFSFSTSRGVRRTPTKIRKKTTAPRGQFLILQSFRASVKKWF